jgi:hypothetical protein
MVRYPQTSAGKLFNLTWYAASFLPLILSGVVGALYSVWNAKRWKNPGLLLPAVIYGSNVVGIIFLSNAFLHYFLYLNPYLIFLSVVCFDQIYSIFRGKKLKMNKKLNFIVLSTVWFFLLFIILLSASMYPRYIPKFHFFHEDRYTNVEFYVGKYVMNITETNDKIWTSEGAIAFFAQRLIVPPNSSDWPHHTPFSDVFAYRGYTYAGDEMKDFKEGVVVPSQFIEAWEKEKVKVIVFLRGIVGMPWTVPYVDELLWNGYRNQKGVADYVQSNYELRRVVSTSDVGYLYEVWVRK